MIRTLQDLNVNTNSMSKIIEKIEHVKNQTKIRRELNIEAKYSNGIVSNINSTDVR